MDFIPYIWILCLIYGFGWIEFIEKYGKQSYN